MSIIKSLLRIKYGKNYNKVTYRNGVSYSLFGRTVYKREPKRLR